MEKSLDWKIPNASARLRALRKLAVDFVEDSMRCLKAKHHGTVWIAVRIYDRTLATWLSRGKVACNARLSNLIGVSVMLSSKLHDTSHVTPSEIADWVRSTTKQIILMEAEVLGDLEWMIYSTPPHSYIPLLVSDTSLQSKTLRLLSAVACDDTLLPFTSHDVAEAAIAVAAEQLDLKGWQSKLTDLLGIVRELSIAKTANPKTPPKKTKKRHREKSE